MVEEKRDRDTEASTAITGPSKGGRQKAVAVAAFLLALAVGVAGTGLAVRALRNEEQARKAETEAVAKQDQAQEAAAKFKSQFLESEAVRKTTAKERDQALAAEQAARRSEEATKAVLDFFKKRLLSAGRPGDVSLTDAFWAGGQGKDLTLLKAVDMAEPQVAEAFADRPLGEASVREMLGLAYLNLGQPAQAVKQYERALALREAMQGDEHSDTAACRNQLAVAYRLAGRTAEAGRLFDRNPSSPAHAAALAVRGSMLLLQKKPAEAELKLRECLTIRLNTQPDDWTTFETRSILGQALLDQKKFAEAEPLLLSGYEGMKQREGTIPSQEKPRINKALERLVKLYQAWDKQDQAVKWRKELEAGTAKKS
jgi:tetratricopeptide (TPR) repeat protein